MQASDFMRAAIAAATQAKQNGGVAIGAVLVQASGKIIATGGSEVSLHHDPTDHAEIRCIREACRRLNTSDLFDCTLYCTLEPCSMCLGCAAWAKIPRIFFGAYRKDVDPSLFDTIGTPGDEQEARHMNLREAAQMQVKGGLLEQECAQLLVAYRESPRHTS